jgi:hypothetical protein
MLISTVPAANGNDNGWGYGDKEFWEPLIDLAVATHRFGSFGQIVHKIFPNLKCIVAASIPTKKNRDDTSRKASMYVSEQNLIAKVDAVAIRKVLFDTVALSRPGKNVPIPTSFADLKGAAEYRADTMNMPDFDGTYMSIQESMGDPELGGNLDPDERALVEAQPFRDVAAIRLDDGLTIGLTVVTTVNPKDVVGKMKHRVMDTFGVLRKAVEMDQLPRGQRIKFALDAAPVSEQSTSGYIPFFDVLNQWVAFVSVCFYCAGRDTNS